MSTVETAKEVIEGLIEQGVDDIIENSDNFIENLKVASGIKKPKIVSKNTAAARGSLASINELLSKDGIKIERDEKTWPLYHVFQNDESYSILFKGKVKEMYEIISTQGIDGMSQYIKK